MVNFVFLIVVNRPIIAPGRAGQRSERLGHAVALRKHIGRIGPGSRLKPSFRQLYLV